MTRNGVQELEAGRGGPEADSGLLEEARRKYEFIVNTAKDAMSMVDANYLYETVNAAYCRNSGKSMAEIVGRTMEEVWGAETFRKNIKPNIDRCLAGQEVRYEAWFQFQGRGRGYFEVNYYPYRDDQGTVTHAVVVSHDITERKLGEEALEHQAFHDTLTGLPNRLLLLDRIRQALRNAERDSLVAGLFLLDLDEFKKVNDSFGHHFGDEVLKMAAERLTRSFRKRDTIARLGGDEFMVVIDDASDIHSLTGVAEQIIELFRSPFRVRGRDLYLGASVGVSVFPVDGAEPETLVKNADMAMYRAKTGGKNTYSLYTRDLDDQVFRRLTLEGELHKALRRDQFVVHYQPKVCLDSGRITGMEALVRWVKPSGREVPPGEFIPVAEETGLVVPIDLWVLETACARTAAWRAMGNDGLRLSVNLSARHLHRRELARDVAVILERTGLDPAGLELEITETALMHNLDESVKLMGALNDMGVRLSLDDFGTGYSSLYYLKKLPIQTIKIDRSFVGDIANRGGDGEVLVKAMLSLASNLGLDVVAEGVENAEQLRFLHGNGCTCIQGYLFSRPVPAEEFEDMLRRDSRLEADLPPRPAADCE